MRKREFEPKMRAFSQRIKALREEVEAAFPLGEVTLSEAQEERVDAMIEALDGAEE
jgi:hypothetical protein